MVIEDGLEQDVDLMLGIPAARRSNACATRSSSARRRIRLAGIDKLIPPSATKARIDGGGSARKSLRAT